MAATARIMIGKFCQTFDLNSSRDSFAACLSLEVGAASVSMIHLLQRRSVQNLADVYYCRKEFLLMKSITQQTKFLVEVPATTNPCTYTSLAFCQPHDYVRFVLSHSLHMVAGWDNKNDDAMRCKCLRTERKHKKWCVITLHAMALLR